MEMHSLARCLRMRPTPSLYSNTVLRSQFVLHSGPRSSLRFSSSNNHNNNYNNKRKTTPFNSATAQQTTPEQPAPPTDPTNPNSASSSNDFDQILNKLNIGGNTLDTAATADQPQAAAANPGSNRGAFPDHLSLSRAVGASAKTDNYRSPSSSGGSGNRRVELKLGPTLGRQVFVEPERGVHLPTALRLLGHTLHQNRVRQQSNRQRFHVRRGQLRKNQRMERWRRLFRFSFKQTVGKIQRMRDQGW
ncbi:mitochondrial 37S ribosomal protein bS21m [Aspergillus candidus]|uniref:Uncharacterized protein n=1 Tax=Aspergillus candidus TaxID=41067 RepID=A0A2I2FFL5_ASPCN|nr:hypothetical protein BDW47DRAFT_103011 [Aspergillus candidus]PLB39413.1 hypothetical protein BDW47DRAFT_103011 [Aspergillus candidus]